MSTRLRRILTFLGGIALVAVLGLVVVVYLLLQPDRFTAMLQTQASNVGLELNLARPASPSLFPRPALDLHGITVNAQAGPNVPILLAARGRLVLPWHTLLGGHTVITRLEIDSPRVDLDALQAWLDALPTRPDNTPPDIPRIGAGISINHGSLVRGNRLLLGNLSLEAGNLAPGIPFPLDITASSADGTPLQLSLSTTPRMHNGVLQLDNIHLHVSQGAAMTATLTGSAHWRGGADASAQLDGILDHADAGQYTLSLALRPADQSNPLLLALKLDGPDNHADLRLPPLALMHWWSQLSSDETPGLSLPPGHGHAEVAKLASGNISIEGFTLLAGDSVAPSGSAAAPAATKRPLISK